MAKVELKCILRSWTSCGHPFTKSEFFRRLLPTGAVVALVENLHEAGFKANLALDLTLWGGTYNRVPIDATAFAHRDEFFLLQHSAVARPDASAAETEAA
jgi:hypothetical protein